MAQSYAELLRRADINSRSTAQQVRKTNFYNIN
jgi:hypothetical protein